MTGLVNRVEELWGHRTTIGLAQYMEVEATIHVRAPAIADYERTRVLRYVLADDGSWFVIARRPELSIPRHEGGAMTASVTRPGEGRTTTSDLVWLPEGDPEARRAFFRKCRIEHVENIHRLRRPDDEAGSLPQR